MILGRHNALSFTIYGGRPVARRYVVRGCVIEGGVIVRAEVAEEPAETLRLPITRERAESWLLEHFEDLSRPKIRELVSRLTRPTGTMMARKTGPLA